MSPLISPLSVSLLTFAAAAGLLTLTPGIDTAMVLRASTGEGPKAGAAAAAGICLGLLVWGIGAALGLTALLAGSRLGFTVVKWAGAGYLIYLGLKQVLKPRSALLQAGAADPPGGRWTGAFRRGLVSNLLNPKVGVFYITFLPQFIPHGYSVATISLVLAGVHVLLSLIWLSILVALTVPLGRFLRRGAVVKTLDRLTGVVFVGFGVRLALSKAAEGPGFSPG
jgi:threonine/homoserine/homoserine lactone efflux protein